MRDKNTRLSKEDATAFRVWLAGNGLTLRSFAKINGLNYNSLWSALNCRRSMPLHIHALVLGCIQKGREQQWRF